jgi:hypothetical protein
MLRESGGIEEFEQIFSTLAQHNKFCPPFFGTVFGECRRQLFLLDAFAPGKNLEWNFSLMDFFPSR